MWILPKQLHTSPFVPDTAALISDSTEQSAICAQSLLARSKPSPARTWSQRWKRDSWTRHLSGRILKPSHGQTFVTAWTSALSVIRANHLVQPASDSEQKIPDTSGHLSQPELLKCDQVSVSPRTSRDISALGYPTCCKTWSDWVTERRGAWRQRVNAARLTRGKGFSSWPTARTTDTNDGRGCIRIGNGLYRPSQHLAQGKLVGQANLSDAVVEEQKNWPSPVAPEVRQGFQDRSKGIKGSQESLTTVVIKHGQAAPASSSSLGSRQGFWASPTSCDHKGATTPEACKQWESRGQNLPEQTASITAGRLNPRWVETLMGLPIGWTMPSCTSPVTIERTNCDSLGTALCQPAQSERSDFLLAS